MKDKPEGNDERRSTSPDISNHPKGTPYKKRRGNRLFDYGELRLLVLAMLAEQPSHGYELIKVIKERFGGYYTPSPGVIYPTLTWLNDMGYAVIDLEKGGRKSYRITAEGEAFIFANRAAADKLLLRAGPVEGGHPPVAIVKAMDNLKFALSLRLKREPLAQATVDNIAETIDIAAKEIEQLINADPK